MTLDFGREDADDAVGEIHIGSGEDAGVVAQQVHAELGHVIGFQDSAKGGRLLGDFQPVVGAALLFLDDVLIGSVGPAEVDAVDADAVFP